MKPRLWIFHVNRPDLTEVAYRSVCKHFDVEILDNSANQELRQRGSFKANLLYPPIPFTFQQSHQWILKIAKDAGLKHYYWMHNDAEALHGTAEGLIRFVEALEGQWGVVFTHYDAMAAFNVEALEAIGGWSDLFEQYFLDNHTYRLLELNGYPLLRSNLGVMHHEDASTTIKYDKRKFERNQITFAMYEQIYAFVWGGKPGLETRKEPILR